MKKEIINHINIPVIWMISWAIIALDIVILVITHTASLLLFLAIPAAIFIGYICGRAKEETR